MFEITYAAALTTILFGVGAAVLFTYARSGLQFMLAVYVSVVALNIGGNVVADVCYTPGCLYLASSFAFLFGMLKILAQFVLIDLFVDSRYPSWRRFLFYGIPCLGLAAFAFSPLAIDGMFFPAGYPAQIIPGVLYTFALILSLSSIAYCATRLTLGLRRESSHTRRMQFWYVLSGLILASAGGLFFSLALPLLGEFRFYSLGPLCTLFFAAGCGYAIYRHQLLDIRIVAQRGIVYALLLTGIVAVYLGMTLAFSYFLRDATDISILFSAGVTTALGILALPATEWKLRKLTDRVFFRDSYIYADALHTLTQVLGRHVEFDDLVRESEAALSAILRAPTARITLGPLAGDADDLWGVQIPIIRDDDPIGCISLSEKRSGDPYTTEDMQLLRTFANQAATALSRAQLYAEAKDHAAELERKVAERTRELSEAHEHERQILNDISHNLQTPLTVLQTKLDGLKPVLGKDALRPVEQSLAGLSGFIYDLLSLARIEGMNPDTAYRTFDLSALLTDLTEEIGVIASETSISVRTNITPGIRIKGDARQMREVIMNVANNALKYMREDGLREISFTLSVEHAKACLVIEDTGLGISANDLPHIFDRFYRGKDALSHTKGTGLGLAIVRGIIEQHGGTVRAESTSNKGTSMTIELPIS